LLDVFHGYLLESNIKFEEINNAKTIFISTGTHTNRTRSAFEDGRAYNPPQKPYVRVGCGGSAEKPVKYFRDQK
jgi:hypothetical protein